MDKAYFDRVVEAVVSAELDRAQIARETAACFLSGVLAGLSETVFKKFEPLVVERDLLVGHAEQLRGQLNTALGLLDQLELELAQERDGAELELAAYRENVYRTSGRLCAYKRQHEQVRSEIDRLGLGPAIEDLRTRQGHPF